MNNVKILQKGYQNFAEGNVKAVLELFDAGIVWDECSGFPFIEGDGIFTGHNAIVQGVFSKIPEYYDDFTIEIDELLPSGDKVMMVGHYAGTWKATGKKFRANATHTWTFKNGKATRFFQAVDTAQIVNP